MALSNYSTHNGGIQVKSVPTCTKIGTWSQGQKLTFIGSSHQQPFSQKFFLTIKNCRKCKTKIKKSFTKILTIILSVKIVLTLRVKLFCPKCKILIVREILVLSFIVFLSEKKQKKRWTMYWRFDLKIREQFIVSAFSLTV